MALSPAKGADLIVVEQDDRRAKSVTIKFRCGVEIWKI